MKHSTADLDPDVLVAELERAGAGSSQAKGARRPRLADFVESSEAVAGCGVEARHRS
jgi:hypothetical protein